MANRGNNALAFWIISIFYLLLFWLSKDFPFFWDNIFFSSKTAHHFLENGLSSIILPPEWDGGHPPFWGTYIALGWKILGRELWVAHLMMLPILIGLGYQVYRLADYFLGPKYKWLGLAIGILEPTVLAQSTMVGPEICMLFAFLLGLNAILRKNYLWLFPATCILVLINTRGVILCGLLFLILILVIHHRKEIFKFKYLEYFISAALIFAIWIYYHWDQTGYLLGHPDSSHAAHRGISSLKNIFFKLIYQIWWILDFGRVAIWITGIYALFHFLRSKKNISENQWLLLKIIVLSFLSYGLFLCIVSNPPLHRYLMFFYILVSLFFMSFIIKLESNIVKGISVAVIALSLFAGQLLFYPNHLATGWDANLKHLDYFKVHNAMMTYIDSEDISHDEVATGFPAVDGRYYSELKLNHSPFCTLDEPCPYLMYSNVMNDLKSRKHLDEMKEMKVIKRFEKDGVFIELLERNQ